MWSISLRWHHISFSNFRFFFSVRSAGRSWIQNSIYWHSPDSLVIYVAKWIIPLFRYLSRHKPEDPALRPGFKYTGFLIVRVDRDDSVREEILRQSDPFFSRRKRLALRKPSHPCFQAWVWTQWHISRAAFGIQTIIALTCCFYRRNRLLFCLHFIIWEILDRWYASWLQNKLHPYQLNTSGSISKN